MQFSEMILNAPVQDNLSRSIRNLNKELKEICRKIADSGAADGKLVVVHDRGRVVFRESSRSLKYRKYLSKKTDRFYYLAKGRYLELLIRLLEYRQNPQQKTRKEHKKNIEKIDVLMEAFEKAGVDFAKITLSEEQYTWARANYNKKRMGESSTHYITPSGVEVRSKSEKKLGTRFEYFGLPYRYEMRQVVNVGGLVKELEEELRRSGWLKKGLFTYDGYECIWNVPIRYAWMNEKGSIWKSYNGGTNEIVIFPDFIFKLRDGSLLIWEHEGMASNFRYRCNASERIFVLRETGAVAEQNLVFSFERDINSDSELDRMIMVHLISRMLF